MNIGVFYDNLRTGIWKNVSDAELVPNVSGLGISHLEMDFLSVKEKGTDFIHLLHKNNMGLAVYLFADENGLTPEGIPAIEELPLMETWGITKLLMVYGASLPLEADKKLAEDKIIPHFLSLCRKAKEHGIVVTVEDFGSERVPCGNSFDMIRFGKKIPDLKFTLDTGNFSCFREDLLEAYERIQNKVVHVHIKDHCQNETEIECVPGEGALPLSEILHRLKDRNYGGWFTVEMFGTPMDDKKLQNALRFIKENFQ